VADVSAPADRARHIRTKRVAELSFEAARTLCGARALQGPPERCPVWVFKF